MKTLTLDITGRCNFNCEFCYQELEGSELSADQILDLVKERPDFHKVEIGGGEPFSYPKIEDIVRQLVQKGRKVHLSTNGTLLPTGLLNLDDYIRKEVTVQVSLPSGNRENYAQITGTDSLEEVKGNVLKLKKYFQTVLSTAIYQRNLHFVGETIDFAVGADVPLRVNLVFPVGKGKEVELLTLEQIDRLKGLLLVEKIKHPLIVDSPLIHTLNCQAVHQAYGLPITGTCPLTLGEKEYYSPKGEARGCEFHQNNSNNQYPNN